MELLYWILVAFAFGFAVRQVGLPPMVGFLLAGFVLNGFGVEAGPGLARIAEVGVTLLLFSIGVKLNIRDLLRGEVWGVASWHMLVTVIVLGAVLLGLSAAGVAMFADLDLGRCLLVAFALSFSSTVFAVKALEEKGASGSLFGRTAVGILIMQDIFAVLFLVFAAGKHPSWWALTLIPILALVRPVFMFLLTRIGHGELMILLGIMLTIAGSEGFELVGLKGDLGALVAGMLVSTHPRAGELAKSLLSFKDLFLVGFFLSIGLAAMPSLSQVGLAALLCVAIPFKAALFLVLLTRFRLLGSTSIRGSIVLANYSEFGLIVASVGVANGWIGGEWLVIIAIALSITFIVGAPLDNAAQDIAARFADLFLRLQMTTRHPEEETVDLGDVDFVVVGMGRMGTGVYDQLVTSRGDVVVGLDCDPVVVAGHEAAGRNVFLGDATDADMVRRLRASRPTVLLLALPDHAANVAIARRAASSPDTKGVMALAGFDDEVAELEAAGANAAFNVHREAGIGFAESVLAVLDATEEKAG